MELNSTPELHQPTDVVCPHPKCGLAFRNQRALKKHFDIHNINTKHIKCNLCNETFTNLITYEKHHRAHAGISESSSESTPVDQHQIKVTLLEPPEASSLKRSREPDQYVDLVAQYGITVPVETKEQLGQHIASTAMLHNQQVFMCRQRENDLVLGLEEVSVTLDRALHMIMMMSGGNLNNIPIDMQLTSLKFSANRRQVHHPTQGYNLSSSEAEAPAFNNTSSSSSSSSTSSAPRPAQNKAAEYNSFAQH